MRRQGLALAAFFLLISPIWLGAQDSPPNVVMIISDDQSWTDYGFMGHPVVQTPRLDQLARESVVFPRGYVPTALCRPSLFTMITGLYAHQHKTSGNDPSPIDGAGEKIPPDQYRQQRDRLIAHIDQTPTLPRLLGQRGYQSCQSGKWWEGNFARGGFTFGMTHGDAQRGGRHGDAGLRIGRNGMKPVFDFLDQAKDQPFFLWYAPFLPHSPHNPPERLLAKYRQEGRPLPLAKYHAMCEWFDETCGQLLDYLEKSGRAENTLVVYVADNGWIQTTSETKAPPGWRYGFAPRSKQSPYEGGTRTPIMLRWPKRLKPERRPEVVSSIDLAPTILAACAATPPQNLPGCNLLEVCAGGKLPREAIFGEGFAHDIADIDDPEESLLSRWCIEGKWKLLLSYDGRAQRYQSAHPGREQGPQLYDLLEDPQETRNLAAAQPDVVTRLTQRIENWWPLKRRKAFP